MVTVRAFFRKLRLIRKFFLKILRAHLTLSLICYRGSSQLISQLKQGIYSSYAMLVKVNFG